MKLAQWHMLSPIGSLYLVASDQGLQGVFWGPQSAPLVNSIEGNEPAILILAQAERELSEYFAGSRKDFHIPLEIKGTPFQKTVWSELQKIPYGKTTSYKDIAQKVSSEKAVRAVGTANGRNPLSIIVPCHRVIASNGTLSGYAGGVNIKETLLRLEQSLSAPVF